MPESKIDPDEKFGPVRIRMGPHLEFIESAVMRTSRADALNVAEMDAIEPFLRQILRCTRGALERMADRLDTDLERPLREAITHAIQEIRFLSLPRRQQFVINRAATRDELEICSYLAALATRGSLWACLAAVVTTHDTVLDELGLARAQFRHADALRQMVDARLLSPRAAKEAVDSARVALELFHSTLRAQKNTEMAEAA